ncbi:hypothetical protein A943_21075 [Bacillus sp. CPSM8]|nr:hypothetical protein SC10_B2orf03085 [Bacillus paralicheniformis]ETB69236.1 hypothetical protein A943_21075 [Bacillus sp. CPSM8]ARA85810.1 hypothetical protein BLMD_10215 [Bacillus paralicheniformis]OLG07425.1 hypothetical protein B4125_1606 [Bacillus paralicheniformis]TWJ78321.1 hypothetical protein CHCC4186_2334 [Bacillus paralicheniformis]
MNESFLKNTTMKKFAYPAAACFLTAAVYTFRADAKSTCSFSRVCPEHLTYVYLHILNVFFTKSPKSKNNSLLIC